MLTSTCDQCNIATRAKGTHSRSNSNPTPTPPMVDEVCVTLLAYILLPVQHAAATASPASQFMHNIHIAQARLPAAAHSPFADAAAPTLPGGLCSVGVFSTHNCLPCCCAAHMPQEMHTHWSLGATTSRTWHTPMPGSWQCHRHAYTAGSNHEHS